MAIRPLTDVSDGLRIFVDTNISGVTICLLLPLAMMTFIILKVLMSSSP